MGDSNYTTVACIDLTSGGTVLQHKMIIPLIWKIENFTRNKLHQLLNGETIAGPDFKFLPLSKRLWKLELRRKRDRYLCVSLGLRNLTKCKSIALQFTISCSAQANELRKKVNVPANARYHDLFTNDDMTTFLENISRITDICDITIQIEMDANFVIQMANSTCDMEDKTKLEANMESILNEALFTDAILRSEGKEIRTHRAILASKSPVFRSMFDNQMIEKTSGVVDIPDVSYDTLQRLVTFLYTGRLRLDDLDVETASELFIASDKYAVQDLHDDCSLILKRSLTAENFLEIYLLADAHSNEQLKSDAVAYFSEHSKEIFQNPDWENAIKERPDISFYLFKVLALKS